MNIDLAFCATTNTSLVATKDCHRVVLKPIQISIAHLKSVFFSSDTFRVNLHAVADIGVNIHFNAQTIQESSIGYTNTDEPFNLYECILSYATVDTGIPADAFTPSSLISLRNELSSCSISRLQTLNSLRLSSIKDDLQIGRIVSITSCIVNKNPAIKAVVIVMQYELI